MPTRRRPRARPKQREGFVAWTGTALVGLLLIAGGFGAGVFLGVLTEAPGAIVGVLAGRGERVPLQYGGEATRDLATSEPSAVPERTAAGAERERVAQAPPTREARQAEPSRLPAVSSPPTGYAVQVGAFATSVSARAMKSKLAAGGYESFVAAGAETRDRRWRVRVGPFASRAQADRVASQLERGEGLSTWVVDLDERSRN